MGTRKQVSAKILDQVGRLTETAKQMKYWGEDLGTGYGPSERRFKDTVAEAKGEMDELADLLDELGKS